MSKRLSGALLVSGFLLGTGCANSPPTSLEGMRDRETSRLVMQCWANHEGERLLFGSHTVIRGCNRWAREMVKVRYPSPSGSVTAFN